MFSDGNLTRLLTKKNRGINTLTVKSLFAQISYPLADHMKNLGKYWKPTESKALTKATVKKLKKKQQVKTKSEFPRYNEDWKRHWKTI